MEGVSITPTGELAGLKDELVILKTTIVNLLTRFNKPYLTTKDVCDMLCKSENWVLLHKEELGYIKKDGALLFKLKDIQDWVDEGYCKPLRHDHRTKNSTKKRYS